MAYEDRSYSGAAVQTTLTANITSTATTIPIANSAGWPDGAGGPFHVAIAPANNPEAFSEVIRCSGRTGLNLNVQTTPVSGRGWDGTTPQAHLTGAIIAHVMTATDLEEANQHVTNSGLDHHTQYLTVARHDLASRHGISNLPVGGTPSTSVVGDTAAAGTSNLIPRSDHKHAREGFGSPVRTGNALSAGVSTSLARSDHVHTDAPIICTSATRPTSPWPGLMIVETDTRRVLVWHDTISSWIRTTGYGGSQRTGCVVTRSAMAIADGGANATMIPWSGETHDSDGFIAPDGTTTYTCTVPSLEISGLYMVTVYGSWSALFTGRSFIEIYLTNPPTTYRFVTTGEDRIAATAIMVVGHTAGVQAAVYQASGSGAKNVTATMDVWRVSV